MVTEDVEMREANYFIRGSRVSLDSIVYGFRNGESSETIRGNFPTLNLEQVNGAIGFYLDHQAEIDAYLQTKEAEFEEARRSQTHISDDLRTRIEEARQHLARQS